MLTERLTAYVEQCFTMPVLPASVLMLLIAAYGLLVVIGALDFDVLDLDIDMDVDVDGDLDAFTSAGFVTLKFLNLTEIPLMIWVSVFGLIWWGTTQLIWYSWDYNSVDPNTTVLMIRNMAIGLFFTKLATDPLAKLFVKPIPFKSEDLVGRECEITTYQATTEFGQAKCATNAAPLILDIRMTAGELAKGDLAIIVDYDPITKIYYVSAVESPP